tara:strand:+ start:1782 stop:2411 length:630 start_codon:yes stop_codon:yes gene_type:complete
MINKDTEIYCSFSSNPGNNGCMFFNNAFEAKNINAIYKSFYSDKILDSLRAVKSLGIKGFAVSMPFKVEIVQYLEELDSTALSVGAVNTIINDDGYLTGYNTDYLAAKEVLNECLGVDLYILGDGGYSLAVQQASKDLGYNPTIITRINWDSIEYIRSSIIFNCTPVENIKVHNSNKFIDCITSTETGKKLSSIQASHQFKLYTGIKYE